jgi:signal-transduction protein with cAMP-binding, CBS, and nucleotidyltransferase domain
MDLSEKINKILKDYSPERLSFKERLFILNKIKEEIKEEEEALRNIEEELNRFFTEISQADLYGLKKLHYFLTRFAIKVFEDTHSVKDVHLICSEGRDWVAKRVIEMVNSELGPFPPFVWVALGSAGRKEETLSTDQDYLLIYEDEADDAIFKEMAQRVVDALEEVGIRKCKGGVMPSNEKWRSSLNKWKERIERTVKTGKKGPLSSLDLMILMDSRFLVGDLKLWEGFRSLMPRLVENKALLREMLEGIVFIPLPLGLFGKFILEKNGPNKGKLNLKTGGWAPLVVLVRLMAFIYGIYETSTLNRIEALRDKGVLSMELSKDLVEAFHILMGMRISFQKELILKGEEDSNFIDPSLLDSHGQKRLRFALRKIEELQKHAHEIFFGGGYG